MMLSLQQVMSVHDLEQIKDLYINSFPAHERREFYELVNQLSKPNFRIFRVAHISVIVGFISVWDFIDFTFVEHFAVSPKHRGLGLGTQVMNTLIGREEKPIVLEVEPPIDELSAKRVKFYSKFGFVILPQVYIQPSYSSNKPAVEMRLMPNYLAASAEWINQCINTITCNVYL